MKSLTLICVFLSIKISKTIRLTKIIVQKMILQFFCNILKRDRTNWSNQFNQSWSPLLNRLTIEPAKLTYKLVNRVSFFHSNRSNSTPYCLFEYFLFFSFKQAQLHSIDIATFFVFVQTGPMPSCHLVGYSLNPCAFNIG